AGASSAGFSAMPSSLRTESRTIGPSPPPMRTRRAGESEAKIAGPLRIINRVREAERVVEVHYFWAPSRRLPAVPPRARLAPVVPCRRRLRRRRVQARASGLDGEG